MFTPEKPRELRRYFDELDFLFDACAIADNALKKKYACRYLDVDTADLWQSLSEYTDVTVTYVQFQTKVYALYPGAAQDRKWSVAEMNNIIEQQAKSDINTVDELGIYYRNFMNVTQFLTSRNRISEAERNRAFIRGFRPALWDRIKSRLDIKEPDHHPDDSFDHALVFDAASFVLYGTNPTSSSSTAKSTATTATKIEDFSALLEKFSLSIVQALSNSTSPSTSPLAARKTANLTRQVTQMVCYFCGIPGHVCKGDKCEKINQYMASGLIRKSATDRVVLADGSEIPSGPGLLHARVDKFYEDNPDKRPKTSMNSMMLSVSQPTPPTPSIPVAPTVFATPPLPATVHSTGILSTAQRIESLEREIFALRNKKVFDGIELPTRNKGAQTVPPPSSGDSPPAPTTNTTSPPPPTPPTQATQPPLHPFAAAREAGYAPPQHKNFGAQPKIVKEKDFAYRTQAPIQDPKIIDQVYQRSMTAPCVTLSCNELLAISNDIRYRHKDVVTPKRVNPAATDKSVLEYDAALPFTPDADIYPAFSHNALVIPDPFDTYVNGLPPGEIPDPDRLTVAKDSHALRCLPMTVNHCETIDSVVDPGSQIIAMSEAVCHTLAAAYDPTIILNMQSANGEIDQSLGLARNIPCQVADITLYLQIHVIRNPAYDILLGRPFDVLTESVIKNYANEDQTITICDPNTGQRATIPTIPRGRPRHRPVPKVFPNSRI
jgi:hypothetical protein